MKYIIDRMKTKFKILCLFINKKKSCIPLYIQKIKLFFYRKLFCVVVFLTRIRGSNPYFLFTVLVKFQRSKN